MTEQEAFEKACGKVGKYEVTDSDLWGIWQAALEWARTQHSQCG